VRNQFEAYLRMLVQEHYATPCIPNETLNGLALSKELLERVLSVNYQEFLKRKPKGTQIARAINWTNMGVTPTGRSPGQAFPPPPRKKDDAKQAETSS